MGDDNGKHDWPPTRLPRELLETFVSVVEQEGDASAAAQRLGISQPTMSKRMAALRALTSSPWLVRQGKRWLITNEGQRVQGVVSNLLQQQQQAEEFIALGGDARTTVSVACGQMAMLGFVGTAARKFARSQPNVRLRLATRRSRARIEGLVAGQFDMVVVAESDARIREIAGFELHSGQLYEDVVALAARPQTLDGLDRPMGVLAEAKAGPCSSSRSATNDTARAGCHSPNRV